MLGEIMSENIRKKDKDGLTPKQAHFARCVASGMSQIDAYKEAYNVGENTLAKSMYEKASRLMAQDNIRSRVDSIIRAKEAAIIRSSVSRHTKVLEALEYFMENATNADSVKLRATELLGKSVGMFKDVNINTDDNSRTSDDIRNEIRDRLAAILENADDHSVH